MTDGAPYRLIRSRASAAEFHARTVADPAPFEIWQHDVVAPAVVLGSSQPETVVDAAACAAAGAEIVRRRSGGGAVLLV
ncbi:MAG: lipoyl protein ligase domain-containing protein, partial [Acidobacteriota bacterium]